MLLFKVSWNMQYAVQVIRMGTPWITNIEKYIDTYRYIYISYHLRSVILLLLLKNHVQFIDNGLIIIISYHGGIIKFEDMILTLQGTIIKPISNVCLKWCDYSYDRHIKTKWVYRCISQSSSVQRASCVQARDLV